MKRRDLLFATLPLGGLAVLSARAAPATDDDALARQLARGRTALLLRHATTDPGIGDPPGFRLDTCSTQRNLSAEGRALARRIGSWCSARELRPSRVRSSAWCRCVDTGQLAFGRAEVWAPLNSFFEDTGARDRQTDALRDALGSIAPGTFEVWITHQVNITALTGEFVAMGEGGVIERAGDAVRVLSRFSVGR